MSGDGGEGVRRGAQGGRCDAGGGARRVASRLEARGVGVRRGGAWLLEGASAGVEAGERVGLIGANGAGKSTLLRAMLGLEPLAAGAVWLDGAALPERAALARRVAYVPQRLEGGEGFTVEELVLQGRRPRRRAGGLEAAEDRARAGEVMRRLGVAGLARRGLDAVSGGERQRALIAAALAQEPDFLLLDEPTSALDLPHTAALMTLLDALRRERGVGVLIATHDLNLASQRCDRLVLLAGGRVVASGAPREVLRPEVLEPAYGVRGGLLYAPHPQSGRVQVLLADEGAGPQGDRAAPGGGAAGGAAPGGGAAGGAAPGGGAAGGAAPGDGAAGGSAADAALAPGRGGGGTAALTWRGLLGRTLGALGVLLLALALGPLIGSTSLDVGEALRAGPDDGGRDAVILWRLRLPRVALAALAGGALAMAGAALQALLRNALATPYTLGVAGGASLGAALVMWSGLTLGLVGLTAVSAAAFVGAALSVALVGGLARALGGRGDTMLLAGIAWSIISSAAVLTLQLLSDPVVTARTVRWLVGGLSVVGWAPTLQALPLVAAGAAWLMTRSGDLNLLAVDEALAATRGVAVAQARRAVFLGASLMVGAVIAHVGPIGFVGLIVPHVARRLVGNDSRALLPVCLLGGGAFLVVADALARSLVTGGELPVGVITALLGGPFLIAVLLLGRRRGGGQR